MRLPTRHRLALPIAAALVVVNLILACAGQAPKKPEAEAKPKDAQADKDKQPKVRDRDAFKATIIGRTKDEVLELIGRPEKTSVPFSSEAWDYKGVSRDPIADRVDRTTTVWFNQAGTVERITYHP